MKIGTVLKKLRMIYSYSAKDLAVELDISPSYLSEIENNKKSPSLDILENFSSIFDIKLSSLLLMAEDFAENENKPKKFVQTRMLSLLTKFSSSEETNNEKK